MNKNQAAGLGILIALFSAGVVIYEGGTGYDVGTPPCDLQCQNCSDCVDALNNASIDYVCLNTSVSNFAGTCIDTPVNASNITFNCQNNIIDGDDLVTSDYGIHFNSVNNITIVNCSITDFQVGIYLQSISNGSVFNNSITSNIDDGISMFSSNGINISNNSINDNPHAGVYLFGTSIDNILFNNSINTSNYGVYLGISSVNNTLNSNTLCNSTYDIYAVEANNTGANNTCNVTYNWNDEGFVSGCAFICDVTNCVDGTLDGSCSIDKPKYCSGGTLYDNCSSCGCSPFSVCNTSDDLCYPLCVREIGGVNISAPEGSCFAGNHPWYCLDGETDTSVENCSLCNCSEGFECLGDGSCGEICYCVNETDCNEKVNLCEVVYLSNSITGVTNFISNPVNFSDTVFDCQGYSITGDGLGDGFNMRDKTGIIIRNCSLSNFSFGFKIRNSTSTLINNYVNLSGYGIYLIGGNSINNSFINSTTEKNTYGVYLLNETINNTVYNSTSCNNTLDFWFYGNNTKENNTCSLIQPDNLSCSYSCSPLVLIKYVIPSRIKAATNVTYYFNVTNNAENEITNLSLFDSELGSIPLIPVGTNVTRTIIYPNETFTVNYTVEVNDTTVNNATVTGLLSGVNISGGDSTIVELVNPLTVTKTVDGPIRRKDMDGDTKANVTVEFCNNFSSKFIDNIDVVFVLPYSSSWFSFDVNKLAASSSIYFIEEYLDSSKDLVGLVAYGGASRDVFNLTSVDDFAGIKNEINTHGVISEQIWSSPAIDAGLDILISQGRADSNKVIVSFAYDSTQTPNWNTVVNKAKINNITIYQISSSLCYESVEELIESTGGRYQCLPPSSFAAGLNNTANDIGNFTLYNFIIYENLINSTLSNVYVSSNGTERKKLTKETTIVYETKLDLDLGECIVLEYQNELSVCGVDFDFQDDSFVYFNDSDGNNYSVDIPSGLVNVTCPNPLVSVVKSSDSDCVWSGQQIEYSYLVTNTGNVDVNVSCVDNYTGDLPVFDLGEGENTIRYLYDSINQTTTNTVNCTACFISECNSSVDSHTVYLADMNITKTTNKQSYNSSENITYFLNLENTGDCNLHDIIIYDKTNNNETVEYSVGSLLVGESTCD